MAFSDNRFSSQQKQRISCILSSLIISNKDLKVSILAIKIKPLFDEHSYRINIILLIKIVCL